MPALPALRFKDAALMRLVGCNAQPVRHGVGPRGAAPRQGPRTTGPIGPEPLADHLVHLTWRDLEAVFHGVIRALAQAAVLAAKRTGLGEATELDTPAHDEGWGQVTRQRQITDTRGQVHELEVTVDGWQPIVVIDARTTLPVAATVVPIQEHDTLSLRALVPQARTHRAGHARLHRVVFATGCWEGGDRWWLQPPGLLCVVPAQEHRAVTVDA
jgi:hypothetical protein